MGLRGFLRHANRDEQSARDIEFYLDAETEDNIARGMPLEQARAAARRKLGNATLIREEVYRMNRIGFLETSWQDARYSLRTMRKSLAFSLTAVLTLAVGIAGNTAMFTVIRGVLLTPLAYRDPDRLVYFSVENPRRHLQDGSISLDQLKELRADAKSFSGLAAYGRAENVMFSGRGEPEALKGARVSANFLDILGVPPLLGRSFLPEEDQRGGRPVAMISSGLWQRRFGGDPQVAGQGATFDSTSYTVIGVLPPGFSFPFPDVDVWVTRPSEWSMLPSRYWGLPLLDGFGRLKPHVSLEQSQAEMSVLQHQYDVAHPSPLSPGLDATMQVTRMRDQLVSGVRPMLGTLFGAVGFVLLIACANVASLLMARATGRSREFAVRAAIGAGRGRLIRQLLAESLLLALAGGALGVLLAEWALLAIPHIAALNLPRSGEIRLDGLVLAFTVALSVVTGLLFGLLPSLDISRPDLASVLLEMGAGAGRSAARPGLFGVSARGLLVIGQVALSIVLLIGAALLMQSFARLHGVNPGFQSGNVLTAKIALPPARYNTDQKTAAFFGELLPRLEGLPGVRAAAMIMHLPTSANWIRTNISAIEGKPDPDPDDQSSHGVLQSVTPGYFRTLEIPLKRGREFTAHDNVPGAPPVVIINESLARRLWPDGENPIGRHIKEGYDHAAGWMEVVGIVADVHEGSLAFSGVQEFYVPCVVHPPQTAYLVMRTDGDPRRFANALRSQVQKVDRDEPVSDINTMDDVLAGTLGQRRLTMWLLGSFAGIALLLAVMGMYGVIAYSVAQRTQEVGIRRALGAQQADILRLVVSQGLGLALAGIAIGIGGAFALTRFIKSLLFAVSATDPATFAGIAVLFLVIALLASYFPARRAARIDPMAALRVG
ncbi:MAG TPA: ABC transporter permease [Bryobacteraceae bacterium]